MYSNRCLVFCKLYDDYNSQIYRYYYDLAASIKATMQDTVDCQLYCSYTEKNLQKQLAQLGEVYMLDPLLQDASDYSFMLNSENNKAALHLFFTSKAYCNSLASSSRALKYHLQKTNRLVADEQFDQASPFSLASRIGAKVVLCLDYYQLNEQTILLLDSLLSNKKYANSLLAFAIYNGHLEQYTLWKNYLKLRYGKDSYWHNQILQEDDIFKSAIRQMPVVKPNLDERLLQLSGKIYKRLANYGLEKTKLKVALAYDEAFSAYDEYELQFLSQLGIEWYKFSPLRDKFLPVNCLAYYFAANNLQYYLTHLKANAYLMAELKNAASNGSIFIAQDQAHLYIIDGVVDLKGKYYPQLGLISQKARIIANAANYAYAQVSTYNNNCFAPQSLVNLALVNQSCELYPNLGGLRCLVTATLDQQQKQINSGYCDKQFFSSLNRFWPTTNYDWLEHFFMTLINRLLNSLYR